MTKEEFRKLLQAKVFEIGSAHGLQEDKAFVLFVGCLVIGFSAEDGYDWVLIGGKNDCGLDFGYVSNQERVIYLIQGKFSETVTRDEIRGFKDVRSLLLDAKSLRDRKANSNLRDFARSYRIAKDKGYQIKCIFAHIGSLSDALRPELDSIEEWGFEKLQKTYENSQTTKFHAPPESVELRTSKQYFKTEDRPGKSRFVVAEVPLKELWRLYQTYKSGLFNANVRLHTGKNTPANQAMRETLLSNVSSEHFSILNNGISILCDRIGKERIQKDGSCLWSLDRPQIINGAQTTYTVGDLDEDQISSTSSVIAKIICPPHDANESFRNRVIRSNNTQTPVTSRDFRSNDEVQKKIFDLLDKNQPRYFYERKLGLWDSLPPREKASFKKGKGYRLIDNELFGQCVLAWQGKPASAKNDKHLLFVSASENGLYEDVYNGATDLKQLINYIFSYELNERIQDKRKEWSRSRKEAEKSSDEDEIREIEKERFVTFFNFYAISGVRHVLDNHVEGGFSHQSVLGIFDDLYDFLKVVFDTQLHAARTSADTDGQIFSMQNWFKRDVNFEIIKSGIDRQLKRDEIKNKLKQLGENSL